MYVQIEGIVVAISEYCTINEMIDIKIEELPI